MFDPHFSNIEHNSRANHKRKTRFVPTAHKQKTHVALQNMVKSILCISHVSWDACFSKIFVTTTRKRAKIPVHRKDIRASNLYVIAPMLARVDPDLEKHL